MKFAFAKSFCVVYALILFFFVSCASDHDRPADLPKLIPTTITILQEGQPVVGATVNLIPEDNSKWFALGLTDEKGVCKIRTHGKFVGAPTGKYVVVVYKTVTNESETRKLPVPEDYAASQVYYAKVSEEEKTFDYVELKYKDEKTSDLRIEIGSSAISETFDVGKPVVIEFVPFGR